jgi:hypothetical protein
MVRRKVQKKQRAKTKTTKQVTKKDGNITQTQTVTVNVPSYQRRAYARRRQAVKKTVNENPYVSGGAVPAMYPQQQLMRSQLKVISDSREYDNLRGKMDALAGGIDKRFTELSTNVDKKFSEFQPVANTIASTQTERTPPLIQEIDLPDLPKGTPIPQTTRITSPLQGRKLHVPLTLPTPTPKREKVDSYYKQFETMYTDASTEMTQARKFGEFKTHTTQTDALVTQPRGVAQLVDMSTDPHVSKVCQGKKADGTDCHAYCVFGSDYCVRHQQYEDKITPIEEDDIREDRTKAVLERRAKKRKLKEQYPFGPPQPMSRGTKGRDPFG